MPKTSAPIDPLTRAIADVLVGELRRQRLTQKELSAATGIDTTSLQRYLAGKRHMSIHNLRLMAEALNTTGGAVALEAQHNIDGISPPTPPEQQSPRAAG